MTNSYRQSDWTWKRTSKQDCKTNCQHCGELIRKNEYIYTRQILVTMGNNFNSYISLSFHKDCVQNLGRNAPKAPWELRVRWEEKRAKMLEGELI